MKLRKSFFIAIFFLGICFLWNSISYAGTQSLNSLNYDVKLNQDGSMDVVETWDIDVEETNTLFKDFNLDEKKYAGITNVEVMDLEEEIKFTDIEEEMYHVTKNCYYALPISRNKFEIAWGVGLDNDSARKKYRISYTILDAIANYEDCSELYWQFVGKDNGIPARNVTGTIQLPKAVENIENLRVWAHGPLNGEIQKAGNDKIIFELSKLPSETMLEVRVIVEEDMFYGGRQYDSKALTGILKEETEWADQANRERQREKMLMFVILGIFVLAYIAFLIFLLTKVLKYRAEFQKIKSNTMFQTVDIGEYFREIPREKEVTPAEAGFLYYSKGNRFFMEGEISKIFSATLLQLCLKGEIAFEQKVDRKKEWDIVFLKLNEKKESLHETEKQVYYLLAQARGQKDRLSMKDLEKYARKYYDEFDEIMKSLENIAERKNIAIGNCASDGLKKVKDYKSRRILYAVLFPFFTIWGFIVIPLALLAIIEFVMILFYISKMINKVQVLTEQGEIERQQWKGLKRYMEDFSLLKEKEIPDLVLWEKYLVYATAFGIADKVIKQLKIVYPEYNQMMKSGQYTYMNYMMHSELEGVLMSQMKSVYSGYQSAYNAAHSSSGSGSGGGFSSGGGGRRWRWPEWAEDRSVGNFTK